jgi:hypothetical protein
MTTDAKENAVDEAPSLPTQDDQVRRSDIEQKKKKEDLAPYTAWVPRKCLRVAYRG